MIDPAYIPVLCTISLDLLIRCICDIATYYKEDKNEMLQQVMRELQTSAANKDGAEKTVSNINQSILPHDGTLFAEYKVNFACARRSLCFLPRVIVMNSRSGCLGIWILGTYNDDEPCLVTRAEHLDCVVDVICKMKVSLHNRLSDAKQMSVTPDLPPSRLCHLRVD